jgi:hypothetical protein
MDLERVKPPDEFNNGPIRRGDSADLSGYLGVNSVFSKTP